MRSRIRYEKVNELDIISKEIFMIQGESYHIMIQLHNLKFSILDNAGISYGHGIGNSLHDCKIKAKKILVDMGYLFYKESRDTKIRGITNE